MRDQTGRKSSDQVLAIVLVAASLLACGTPASAQHSAGVRSNASNGSISLERPLHAAVRREAAGLAQTTAANQQSAHKPDPNWFARHPVIVGTLIGTAAGAVLSHVGAIGGANHDPRVTLVGAGAGAWGGLVASAVQKSRAKERIGRGTKIGIVAGAVAFVVVPIVACYGAGGCGGSS